MNNHVVIYHRSKPPALDPAADYLQIHAGLQPGHLRLTPAAIRGLCRKYRKITLVLPLTTNDALQQGSRQAQETFLIELFRHWTKARHVTLNLIDSDSRKKHGNKSEKHVTSVQIWHEKSHMSAEKIALSYFRFLPVWSRRLIHSSRQDRRVVLSLFGIKLLELEQEKELEVNADISAWIIKGGRMTGGNGHTRGRMWFVRSGVHPGVVYAALTHYRPSLPWSVYLFTQAALHRVVMHRFGCWRNRIMRRHYRRLY